MCGYAVIGRHHLHNLERWWCKGAGFGCVQGRHIAPGVVGGHPEELPVGEPSGCVPALVLPLPNLSKSWCPLSLHVDEHHDRREDWEDTLHYLLGFPRRHHRAAKDTTWGCSLRGGVLCAVGLGLCGCDMMWRTWGWARALPGVPSSLPQASRVRHGRARRGWKRRVKGGRR